jgi:diguanylate cyclase (GGDEF)-like protein
LGAVALVAAVLVVWAVPVAWRFALSAPNGFWSISLLALVADLPLFGVARRRGQPTRTTLSVCFTFAILLLWGAAPAIIVQTIAAAIVALGRRLPLWRGVSLCTRLVCALAAAEIAVRVTGGRTTAVSGASTGEHLVVFFLLPAATWLVVSFGLMVAAGIALRLGGIRTVTAELREDILGTTASMLLVSPMLILVSGWWSALLVLPLLAWRQLSREYTSREEWLRREPDTGVLNRRGLIAGLEDLTANDVLDPEHPRPFGVVLLNVESVLAVNSRLGRDVYEEIVAAAARRLIVAFGEDHVGRIGGEGFVVLRPELAEANAVAEATQVARVLTKPLEVNGIPFGLDPAAGVALSPEHGRDFGALMANAEIAMSEARRLGQLAQVYVREAAATVQRRVTLLSELHAALRDPRHSDEIAVLYQPQIDVRTGQLAGVEALLRWTHPTLGPVRTDELIAAIETSDVMHLLTRRIIEEVTAQLHAWNDNGFTMRASVNASMHDLHDEGFPERLRETLHRHALRPTQLTVEITEGMMIADSTRVVQATETIAALGVGLSLDDFGTGYASLQQLRLLPLTELKLDRSYVSQMTANQAERAIVTSVHQFARALKLEMVAEGVEDAKTAAALAQLPGTIGQGWYFGRPMTAHELEKTWANNSGHRDASDANENAM